MARLWTHIVSLLFLLVSCASALDPSLDISQYAHTTWKVRDGFARGFLYSIAQTPDGYLWLGTEFGLLRFDGVRAVPWQPPRGQQMPGRDIPTLLVTRDGALWIGTFNGLARWKDEKFTTYPELNGVSITALLEDHEGTVWIGARSNKFCLFRDEKIQCSDGMWSNVRFLYEDSKGNLLVSVKDGFWKWKPGQPEFFKLRKAVDGPSFGEYDGTVLVGMQEEILEWAHGRVAPYSLPGLPRPFRAFHMLRDRDGGFWIGAEDRGLIHYHQGKADGFSEADGLSGDTIRAIFQDREGSIWVVTPNGLDRFREYAVASFGIKQGLSNSNTLSVLASNDGSIWIATYNGLNRWKNRRIAVFDRTRGGALNGWTYCLFQDSSGRIWVSTLSEFGYLENDRFVPVIDLQGGWAFSVAEVPAGHLWVAVDQDRGLFHLFQGRIVRNISWAGLGHKDHARVLLADPSGRGLWLGFADGGVSYFADGRIQKSYSVADGLGAGSIDALRFGQNGGLWSATEHGLSRIKDSHIATLTSKNGLPCDSIHWSIADADQFVWVYSACGLMRIPRADIDAWIADPSRSVKVTLFDVSDGVPSHSFPSETHSVAKSSDGRIWFAAYDGLSFIDPRHFPSNTVPPPVRVEQITADDKPYDASNGLRLPPRIHDLTINYTALSLVDPAKVRFRYKLEGQDTEWREVVNDREVQYSNLAPGNYRFRVIASNNSGVWNKEGASLEFVIPPMWYQTNWFYALCAATSLGLLWAAYQLRVRQLAAQFNMRLEERVSERTRLARDLHDTLLQSFQALLPLLQAAIYKLPESPADARKTLESAVDQASDAITEGRDAVQGLRMSTVEKNDLAVAIRTIGEELASAEGNQSSPNFNVVVEGTSRNLHPILRDEVYRLAAEALRNAFKHAAAQSVEVEIRYDEKHFRLRVRDDGKGISPEVLRGDGREGHYGLSGMNERASLAGGKLTIWSEVDSGTEVELIIPASKAYAKSPRPFWYSGNRAATDPNEKETIERE